MKTPAGFSRYLSPAFSLRYGKNIVIAVLVFVLVLINTLAFYEPGYLFTLVMKQEFLQKNSSSGSVSGNTGFSGFKVGESDFSTFSELSVTKKNVQKAEISVTGVWQKDYDIQPVELNYSAVKLTVSDQSLAFPIIAFNNRKHWRKGGSLLPQRSSRQSVVLVQAPVVGRDAKREFSRRFSGAEFVSRVCRDLIMAKTTDTVVVLRC